MSDGHSVTRWIEDLKRGDSLAAQEIWRRYVERLIRFARKYLANSKRGIADEEDVVVCAFNSIFRGVEEGRFPRLDDRDDLWQLLLTLCERKAIDQKRRESATKRGGGAVRGESVFGPMAVSANPQEIEPTPESAAIAAEQLQVMFDALRDEQLKQIAIYKLEGLDNKEIAARTGTGRRTVERRLQLIRQIWEETGIV